MPQRVVHNCCAINAFLRKALGSIPFRLCFPSSFTQHSEFALSNPPDKPTLVWLIATYYDLVDEILGLSPAACYLRLSQLRVDQYITLVSREIELCSKDTTPPT